MSSNITAIMPAGGKSELWQATVGQPYKALLTIGEDPEPLYLKTVRALSGCQIETVVIADWVREAHDDDLCRYLPGGETMIDNLRIGLESVQTEYILFASADMPSICSGAVDRFIDSCWMRPRRTELFFSAVPKSVCEREFPGIPRTYAYLLGRGPLTLANIALAKRQSLLDNLPALQRFYELRKSPVKLAGLFGWDIIALFLCRLLSVGYIQDRAERLFGLKCDVVVCDQPGAATLANDIDKPRHLEAYLAFLKEKQRVG